jgi:poly(3-hydroxybutyrate) depolymerase
MNLITCVQILPLYQQFVLPQRRRNLSFLFLCFFFAFSGTSCSTAAKSELSKLKQAKFTPGILQQRTFLHDGMNRSYWLYVPTSILETQVKTSVQTAAPALLTVLHGSNQSGETMLYMGDFVAHAEKHKYILLAPNAQGAAFNDGSNRVEPEFRATSDTGFLIALNAYLTSKLATDTGKN